MRWIIFLFTIACFFAGTRLGAQSVTLRGKNTPIEKVFKEITRQTGFLFFYADGLLKKKDRVTVIINKAPLEQALNLCFSNLPFTYTIVDKTIVVKEAVSNRTVVPIDDTIKAPPIVVSGKVV